MDLCGKCGNMHEWGTECPDRYCPKCGTTHKPNEPFTTTHCAGTEHFGRYIERFERWQKENTRQIWAQPEKESEEE